eukprot:15430125-Alexandrium_andersonii.AAC.2
MRRECNNVCRLGWRNKPMKEIFAMVSESAGIENGAMEQFQNLRELRAGLGRSGPWGRRG